MFDLFRKEAVENITQRLLGDVILVAPLPARALLAGIGVFVVVCSAFVSVATYTRRQPVLGWVVPQGGLIRVVSPRDGVVTALPAAEGQPLSRGQKIALLRVSPDVAGGDAGLAIAADLQRQQKALLDQQRADGDRLRAQLEQLRAQHETLLKELRETEVREQLASRRAELAQAQLDRTEPLLAKGFVPTNNYDALKVAAMTARMEHSKARSDRTDAIQSLADTRQKIAALNAEQLAAAAKWGDASANLSQKVTSAQAEDRQVITSSIDGRILAVPIEVGQHVAAGGTVAVIVPRNERLEVELFVPSRAAGLIRRGQAVRVRYQAFPYQAYGAGRGVITSVSRSVLLPADVAGAPFKLEEPVFRVRAKLEQGYVRSGSTTIPVQPGMLLNAEIETDKRTLLAWITAPFRSGPGSGA